MSIEESGSAKPAMASSDLRVTHDHPRSSVFDPKAARSEFQEWKK